MTVKKLKSKKDKGSSKKKAPTTVKKKKKKSVVLTVETRGVLLPTEKKKPDFNLNAYTVLLYGREKIGKTTAMSTFKDSLILATEPGTKGLEIFEVQIGDWSQIRQVVDELEKSDKFRFVCFDTADRAYDMCLDWVCKELDIEYPGQSDDGKEDFGKSWRAVRLEFTDVIHRIERTGRGVGFTSHMKESTISTKSGGRYDMIYPSMGKQARQVIAALVDLFFFADYMTDVNGQTRRVLITQGDETIWAGHRKVKAGSLPMFLPLEEENAYGVIEAAFNGDHPGIDPAELRIGTRQGSDVTQKFLMKLKGDEARRGSKGKGVLEKKKLKKKKKKIRR